MEMDDLGDEHSTVDLMYPWERKCFDLVASQSNITEALNNQSRFYDEHRRINGSFRNIGEDYYDAMNSRFKWIYEKLLDLYKD